MNSRSSAKQRWALWLLILAASAWLFLSRDKSPAGDSTMSFPARLHSASSPVQPIDGGGLVARRQASPQDPALILVPRDQLFANADGMTSAEQPAARDLFTARSWSPPPPVRSEQPAPPPVAPPLPYTFLGKKLEGDTWEVFIARGEQTFVARTNQVVENEWRVDRIAPPTLTLTYLPLGLSQALSIGEPR